MFKKYYFCVFIIFLNCFCYVLALHCRDSILNLPGNCTINKYCDSAKELQFYYGIPSTQCYYSEVCCVSPVSGNVKDNQQFRYRISATNCIANRIYENKWTYQTPQSYLAHWTITNGFKNTKCAGALISPIFILTSASCTLTDSKYSLTIYLSGSHYTGVVNSEQLLPHPSFDKMILNHDIGLIKLTSPINYSQYYYPCLWQTNAIYSKKLTIFDVESSTTSDLYISYRPQSYMEITRFKNKLTLFKNDPCGKFIVGRRGYKTNRPHQYHMNNYKLCLANLEAKIRGCGEIISGTPITTKIGNIVYIVGVASETKCQTGHLMRHSRVSSYLDWIEPMVWRNGYVNYGYQ